MVANLGNVDEDLAELVAAGLGLAAVPDPSDPASPPITDLAPSVALSILANGPETLAGRKVGVLVTDGADADLLTALQDALDAEGVTVELIAPTVGGIDTSDGERIPTDQKLGGGPSVLYDAVALVVSDDLIDKLTMDAAALEFVTTAFAHCKFVGYVNAAQPLFEAAGLSARLDRGFVALENEGVEAFVERSRELRVWERELLVTAAR